MTPPGSAEERTPTRFLNVDLDIESFPAVVQPSTLQRVAALGASIEITIYPASFGEQR